jgi:flagellar biosynthesis anti-sigma factor FlgM
MVDSIKNIGKAVDLQNSGGTRSKTTGAANQKNETSARAGSSVGVDSVSIGSSAMSKSAIVELASAPPIDSESVSRIKDAIKTGNYPIDLDAVADMLLEAYKDLKT